MAYTLFPLALVAGLFMFLAKLAGHVPHMIGG